jgi:hypothetical protein
MTMNITLDVFSGRPNPTWTLSDTDKNTLISRVAGKTLAGAADAEMGHLGFRGYIVSTGTDDDETAASAGLPPTFRIGASALEGLPIPQPEEATASMTAAETDDATQWLLSTAAGAVEDEVLQFVSSSIAGEVSEAPAGEVAALACIIENTAYNPAFWNDPAVQPKNNCYNYAMNWRSDTFAQPGKISGHPNGVMQCPNVATAADWDGCKAFCSGTNKNVALVIWPGADYHWYRRHSNGFWGHKPGQTAARNVDNLGRVIGGALNPQNCARGPYTIFCGWRFSPKGMRVS